MITPELLRQSGYVELTPGMDPVALEVGEGEAACFFMQLPDGQCATSAIRAVPTRQTDGMPAHELAYVTTQGGTRGWGRSGWIREGRPNRCLNVYDEDSSATFTVEELPGGERFRVTAGVEERHTDGRDE
jgi:hypothetical protein